MLLTRQRERDLGVQGPPVSWNTKDSSHRVLKELGRERAVVDGDPANPYLRGLECEEVGDRHLKERPNQPAG